MVRLSYLRPALLRDIRHDCHCVIEASAGTGKTYAIEHLVLDLILGARASIDNILVLTFTEKATTELRSRIRALIEKVLSNSSPPVESIASERIEIDDEARLRLEDALFSFDAAPVHTIHGFCYRILSELAFDTRSSLGLEVVDAYRIFHRAFRSTLREVIAIDPSHRMLLDEWMTDGRTAGHPNLVDSLEELLREAHFTNYFQTPTSQRHRRAIKDLAANYDSALLVRLLTRNKKRFFAELESKAAELASILQSHGGTADNLHPELASFDYESLRYHGLKTTTPSESQLVDALEAAEVACSLDVRVVESFLPSIEATLRADKVKHNEIDYDDMLKLLWEALSGATATSLLTLLRSRFRFALVDEFQDTDDLQWKILRTIFLDSPSGNTLYVVGDPKQAIYSFRGADVFTYLGARDDIFKSGGASVALTENYRSTGHLIEATNELLNDNATSRLFTGRIRYDTPVRCGRNDFRAKDYTGQSVIPITILKYRHGGSPASVARLRAAVGRFIALEIRQILTSKPLTILDGNDPRLVTAKDIYILTRTGAEAIEVGGHLRECAVPYAFYKKEGLFQTSEAYDVLDVLKAIQEPDSHSQRLKAWISPFFAVSYADLFESREAPPGHPLNERLYEWSSLAHREQFATLFDQLIHRSGLASRELFLANSARELTNYLHIFEILLAQSVSEGLSLPELIARLESFIKSTAFPGGAESGIQRVETDRSAVQIMTVHMSKGLQADVVFLFGGIARPTMPPRMSVY